MASAVSIRWGLTGSLRWPLQSDLLARFRSEVLDLPSLAYMRANELHKVPLDLLLQPHAGAQVGATNLPPGYKLGWHTGWRDVEMSETPGCVCVS